MEIDLLLAKIQQDVPEEQKRSILRNLHVRLLAMTDAQLAHYKRVFGEYGSRFRASRSPLPLTTHC